jgi:antitoxin component YwqK of YwqJK toxin-antitoxin module
MAKSAKKTRYTHYHKDGSLYGKGYMLGGKMEGYWEWFRKDGSRMRSGNFARGKQVGEWITYDKKGKPVKVTQMK